MTNCILKRKYDTQKKLSEEAGYDLKKYAENTRKNVDKIVKKYNLPLNYATKNPSKLK